MTNVVERAVAQQAGMTITRVFKASRSLVYTLWTDPKYVALWWGIEGTTNPVCEMDVRPGGEWRVDMRTGSGAIYPNRFEFLEVVDNERLVYRSIRDAKSATGQGEPALPAPVHTVTFLDEGVGTRVSLETVFASDGERDRVLASGVEQGIGQSWDRLERLIESVKPETMATPATPKMETSA